jgi:hypothetical protein
MKFGIDILYKKPSGKGILTENRLTGNRNLFKGVNEYMRIISVLLTDVGGTQC